MERQAIEYEVIGMSGEVAFQGSMADPLVELYEGVGASGELQTVEIEREEVEFTIRIPYSGEEQTIAFYRTLTEGGANKVDRRPIGSFELPH
jgi:hypothetical protein